MSLLRPNSSLLISPAELDAITNSAKQVRAKLGKQEEAEGNETTANVSRIAKTRRLSSPPAPVATQINRDQRASTVVATPDPSCSPSPTPTFIREKRGFQSNVTKATPLCRKRHSHTPGIGGVRQVAERKGRIAPGAYIPRPILTPTPSQFDTAKLQGILQKKRRSAPA